VSSNRIRTLLH